MQVSFTVCCDCCTSGATPLVPHLWCHMGTILGLTFCTVGSVLNQCMPKVGSCTVLLLKSEINTCTSGETHIQSRKYAFPIQLSALNYQRTDEGTAWICAWHIVLAVLSSGVPTYNPTLSTIPTSPT